jgi:uncharacterized protein YjiK
MLICSGTAFAAPFQKGSIAVFQAAASVNNTTASVVEVSPDSTTPSTPLQTIAIDGTTLPHALRFSGSATSTGYLSSTADRSLLSFSGHNSVTTGVNANTLTARGVGALDGAGTFSLAATYTGNSGSQARSATSLNNSDWIIADQAGIYTNSTTAASPAANVRSVKTFGGTVYVMQASSVATTIAVNTLSAISGGVVAGLPGLINKHAAQDFYLVSSGETPGVHDILYLLTATSNTAGAIEKYSLIDGIWTESGSHTTPFGGFGLAAADSGDGAILYVTTGLGALTANSLLKIADAAGYNEDIAITNADNVTLYTAPSGSILKGVEFAPFAPFPDLATYIRVARHHLPEPTRTPLPEGTPEHNVLCEEASAVTYNWDTDTLFITGDGGRAITQVSKTGELIDTMTLAPQPGAPQGTAFYDPEGLTYIGNGEFVMSEERDRQLVKFTYSAGATLTRDDTQTVKIGTFDDNTGTEGLSWDPLSDGFIVVKEKNPIGLFQTGVDFSAGIATNGSPETENSIDLFDVSLLGMTDLADVFALSNVPSLASHPRFGNLLVLSQEDARVVNISRSGEIHSTLQIVADPGSPLSVAAQQHEGITMDRDGVIYVVSENGGGGIAFPQLWVYAPTTQDNTAPTAVLVENATTSITENTSTLVAIRIGDIIVSDDGLGLNTLAISGPDAAFFQIIGATLYLRSGTVLDYESRTSYSITITVDDATVGETPDSSVDFTLTVLDQEPEAEPPAVLIVTEVAPWSSANSPLAADWFEVTNISESPVDITGWKFDDNSNQFSSSVALNGITTIAAGESVIFIDSNDPTGTSAAFIDIWFGGNAPTGLQIGNYAGTGIGLGSGGDAVNLFEPSGILHSSVRFGASPTSAPFKTFDNTLALDDDPLLATFSEAGVNGAISALTSPDEIGSPGYAAPGILRITEVAPWSSGNSPLLADWFEVTNIGARAVNIIGWKVDDSSESPAAALPLVGVSSIAPGESVIFLETADLEAKVSLFKSNWFGANPPENLRIGGYSGESIGLSTGGDAVNLFDTNNVRRANISFGIATSTAPYATFDNTAAVDVGSVTLRSVPGVNGAFVALNSSSEVGSPGTASSGGPIDFAFWLTDNGYVSGGFGADTDGDGVTDGLEFFFNMSPNSVGNFDKMPKLHANDGGSELRFTRLTDTGDISGTLQVSSDLQTWSTGLPEVDFTVVEAIVNGRETTLTYALPGSGPSISSESPAYLAPNTSVPRGATLGGVRVVNHGMVGAGRVSGDALDSFGETLGGASGLAVSEWQFQGNQFVGKFQLLPDRGYNKTTVVPNIFSNYNARVHEIDFTFVPHYGAGVVAQNQILTSYRSSTKFTYLDGSTLKYTSGLNPTGISMMFGQSVGTVVAANGPGGAQEAMLSFDAEAIHLFDDGSGYVSDEYGGYICRFNASKQITGITQLPASARPHRPATVLNFDSTAAPANGRRNNQGIEGMSVTPDGTLLFAMMQSALVQDTNGSQQDTRNHTRLYVYDVAGENREVPLLLGEFVVRLPQLDLNGNGSGLDGTAAQSEIVAISNSAFLMLPRDGNGMGKGTTDPIVYKSVQLVDFSSATNILGRFDGVGQAVSPGGLLAAGVRAAATAEIINMLEPTDLAKFGFNTNTNPSNSNTINEKMEGFALVPDLSTPEANDFFLFIANDNDFQSSDVMMVNAEGNLVSNGDGRLNAGITNDVVFYAYRISIDAGGRMFYRFEVDE